MDIQVAEPGTWEAEKFYIGKILHWKWPCNFERISSVIPANIGITNKYLISGVKEETFQMPIYMRMHTYRVLVIYIFYTNKDVGFVHHKNTEHLIGQWFCPLQLLPLLFFPFLTVDVCWGQNSQWNCPYVIRMSSGQIGTNPIHATCL